MMLNIGVYGGTFNPPHLGHVRAAGYAMDALGLDKLLFVPAALPPHKALPGGSPSPEQRYEMTCIAADNMRRPGAVEASDLELGRGGKSYTADTLAQVHAQYPDARLWFLAGGDMLKSLPAWYEPGRIMSLASVAAFARNAQEAGGALEGYARALTGAWGGHVEIVTLPEITEVSSTRLRDQLSRGEGRECLQDPVYGYILLHALYGVHADLKRLDTRDLRACSYSMVRAKRIPHIRGTEEESVRLAVRWGADPEKARRAGILHDCTKYLELAEQLQLCREYGVALDDLEQKAVKLLHSKTGAAVARHVFGAPDDIFEAIFWHTTGKADMTLLEKILYLADYIEPTRDFDGVEELRTLAYRDLDAAVLQGLEMSMADLNERGVPVHRNTRQARDWLLQRKG